MKDEGKSREWIQNELMELHQGIAELEKLENERGQNEKELQIIEEKVHRLFDQVKEGIAIIQDRLVKYINPFIKEIMGYTPEELIGTSFAHYVHPNELPKLAKYYLQRLAGEDVPPIYETIVKHKNGSDVYLEIKASVVTYQGKLADFAIFKEIAKQKNK